MLLARMAEAVYWAGRHLERAEGAARIVQVHTDTHVDLPVGEDIGWEPLLAIAGVAEEFTESYPPGPPGLGSGAAEEDVVEFLIHGQATGSSILSALTAARQNLRTARPVVPREAWEACNDLWLTSTDRIVEAATREGRVIWLRRVVAGCQRIAGILQGTMNRDEAMSFLAIGQNLERADLTARVLQVRSDTLGPTRGDNPYDVVRWMAVLRSLAAYQPFRRAMPARPQGGSTLRFLLQDDRFPRGRGQPLRGPRPPEGARACRRGPRRVHRGVDGRLERRGHPPRRRRARRLPRGAAARHRQDPPADRRDLLPPAAGRMAAGTGRRLVTNAATADAAGADGAGVDALSDWPGG